MYIDAKILIPFLPLLILVVAKFLTDLTDELVSTKMLVFILLITFLCIFNFDIYIYVDLLVLSIILLLFKKFNKKYILHFLMLISIVMAIIFSLNDPLVDKKSFDKDYSTLKKIIDYIRKEDNSLYRIAIDYKNEAYINQIFENPSYLSSTIYSSLHNRNYSYFYYEELLNNIKHRNRVITTTTTSDYYLNFLSNKYIVTKKKLISKKLIKQIEGYNIYLNESSKPMFYLSDNLISENYYDKLKFYEKPLALMNYDVVKQADKTINLNIKKDSNISLIKIGEVEIKKDLNYSINLDKVKTLFIRITMYDSSSCKKGDTYIDINNIRNKLTCKSWKYHNKNYTFDYLTTSDKLNIFVKKGKYYIKSFEIYEIENLNVEKREEVNFKYSNFIFTTNIKTSKDKYLITNIPYDKGFKVYVDNKEIKVEQVNKAFLGFKIPKGNHKVTIKFTSPLKKEATIITIVSFIVYLYLLWKDNKDENLFRSKLNKHKK